MGQDPSAIRQDIEATREHMGETVDALVSKTDGTARARQRVGTAREELRHRATATKEDLVAKACEYASHPGLVAEQATVQLRRAQAGARDNPRSVARGAASVAAVAAGFMMMAIRARRRQSVGSGPSNSSQRRSAATSGRVGVRGRHSRRTAEGRR